jgi:ATP-dependent Clp protease ATP-binding subunit ClpA
VARPLPYLSAEAQSALDLAKRAVPPGSVLTAGLLMAAAYHEANLAEKAPQLASYLPAPQPLGEEVPDEVAIAEGLRPVFGELSRASGVSVSQLMVALLRSAAGRNFIVEAGATEEIVDGAVAALADGPQGPVDWRTSPQRSEAIQALSAFGRMLTVGEPPKKGLMRMDRYIRALQKNLLKMRRASVIVIGQPGTGKTALVREFARMIVEGDTNVVPALRDRDVFELSPSFLRAGASMVGQYDQRVSTLLQVLEANPKVILFVDEVHSLLSSGMHERGPFSDANESFKTAVGRGGISLIGATTLAEYRHYIAPDGALARRFGLIKIDPPTVDESVAILQGRVSQYRQHYAPLVIPDSILPKTVEITEDLLPDRFQPDKSLELLDEACALATMTTPPLPEVSEEALLQSVEDALGHSVVTPGMLTEAGVLEKLKEGIVGQDETLKTIARGFVAGMSKDWLEHNGPRRVFFFCGPTGVGKTETARILAKILGGGPREAMLRIDCNTLQGSASEEAGPIINRLLGVPPGYIGYARGEGGMLSRIRDMPECVVLFDEIEKASPAISKVLLQVLDEGRVEDTDGSLLDFRRSFVVFTTNAGTAYEERSRIGFGQTDSVTTDRAGGPMPTVSVEAVLADLRARGYGEEFFGRQIDFVVFRALGREDAGKVLVEQLESLRDTAELRGYELSWDPDVEAHLMDEWRPRFGARWVFTILRNRITEQLALADAQGDLKGVKRIHIVKRADGTAADASPIAGLAARRREDDTLVILVS